MKFETFKHLTDLMVEHWKAVDSCYNIVICETLEGLYDYLAKNNYFKV